MCNKLFRRLLEILVVLKFAQFIQIKLSNGLLLLQRLLRYRVTHQNALVVGVKLAEAELHLLLLGCLVEMVLEFRRILIVKRRFILDISLQITTLGNPLTQNLSQLLGLVVGNRVTPLHELVDVVCCGVLLRRILEDLLMSLQVLLVGIGALILLVRLLRLQNVRV